MTPASLPPCSASSLCLSRLLFLCLAGGFPPRQLLPASDAMCTLPDTMEAHHAQACQQTLDCQSCTSVSSIDTRLSNDLMVFCFPITASRNCCASASAAATCSKAMRTPRSSWWWNCGITDPCWCAVLPANVDSQTVAFNDNILLKNLNTISVVHRQNNPVA